MTIPPLIDTIVAQATPPGRGGVGIVRISGPCTARIASAMLGHLPQPRYAEYLPFYATPYTTRPERHVIDRGIVLYFPAPHSFTGEDVLELQGHGGPVVMDMLVRQVITLGARLARPGEFSERAFLNDKLDLVQSRASARAQADESEDHEAVHRRILARRSARNTEQSRSVARIYRPVTRGSHLAFTRTSRRRSQERHG